MGNSKSKLHIQTPNITFIVKFGWCYDISVVSKKNQCEFIVIQELSYSKLEKYLTLSGTSVRDLEKSICHVRQKWT